MLIYLVIALLPIAALSGWWAHARAQRKTSSNIPHAYFIGLNYLLNEEPDKAVDVFIKMLEVDGDTLETHLALGSLFRRRGEVNRAIKIHQNLVERSNLNENFRIEAMLELGQDYLRAGVFDRAEYFFKEILDLTPHNEQALRFLIDIYQQERDWERAIHTAKALNKLGDKNMSAYIAHFYCELTEQMLAQHETDQANLFIKQAMAADRDCVRASLLQGDIELKNGEYLRAIRAFKRVKAQDPDFISESIPSLIYCYNQLNDEKNLLTYLRQCLEELPKTAIVLFFTKYLQQQKKPELAEEFLFEQLEQRPFFLGLAHLLTLQQALRKHKSSKNNLVRLSQITDQLLASRPTYLCHSCGYTSKNQLWQCPGCKTWNSVKPLHGIKGIDA